MHVLKLYMRGRSSVSSLPGPGFLRASCTPQVLADMPRKKAASESAAAKHQLKGLAEAWETDKAIRSAFLKTGCLFVWPSPQQTGIINFTTMEGNWRVINAMLEIWLPKIQNLKTISVHAARHEALRCSPV